jgi:hypothetical protein
LRSSHGGAAVSKTAGRGFDSFRACAPGNQPGHQHLDNFRGILVGASTTWPRNGSVAPWGAAGCRPAVFRQRGFDSLPAHRCASRLTGRAPGPYPGQDWVRGPGRARSAERAGAKRRRDQAPCRRSSASGSAGPSSRRSRVQIPPVARNDTSTWPNGSRRRSTKPEGAGSTPAVDANQLAVAQKDESTAFRGRGSHVRVVPARPRPCSSASQSASLVRTRPWVRPPPRAPTLEGIRPDEEPACYAGTGQMPVWVHIPLLPLEATRPDEEPVPKTGRGCEALGRSSRPASAACRDGPEVTTPGPQPGERGSTPRRGAHDAR